ncbi:MAG TPA: PaaX family transcriptional regulator C-terminal domain-containing protein [Acidimicrobiia bacterium]|nr:PaaX family transcriptional regulator C-terminal domain-containing protein [Acidimicrobiia bacterium]
MTEAVPSEQWARRSQALGVPSTRGYLLTVLGEFVLPVGGRVWTAALLDSLGALGVEERTARQAVWRSAERGLLESERVGRRTRWALSDAARRLLTEGTRRIYSLHREPRPWDGRWLLLYVSVPESQRDLRHRMRTRLGWAGFASLGSGTWVSPWIDREIEVREVLEDLGLSTGGAARSFIAKPGGIGDVNEMVAATWPLGEIAAGYDAFLERFGTAPPAQSGYEAFVNQVRLVHEWRRFPFLDPDLPGDLLPRDWSGYRAAELFHRLHEQWRSSAWAWWRERMEASGPMVTPSGDS